MGLTVFETVVKASAFIFLRGVLCELQARPRRICVPTVVSPMGG